jgi:hypothetical protein
MNKTPQIKEDAGAVLGGSPCSRILRLTLKKKWFQMISAGVKKEEYRKIKPWILSRLQGKSYDVVEFSNGYGKHVPKVTVEYLGWGTGTGRSDWGATPQEIFVIIRLGKIISANRD